MPDFTNHPPLLEESALPTGVDAALLEEVSDAIRQYCEWHIATTWTETFTVDADGGTILDLPTLHLINVVSVVDKDGAAITGWTKSVGGQLELATGWPTGLGSVVVVAEHGYPTTPASLAGVVADMIRDRSTAAEGSTVSGVKLDGADISYSNPFAPRGSSSDVGARRDLSVYPVLDRFRLFGRP